MTETRPQVQSLLPEPEESDTPLPPPRVREPGSGRETLIHWIVTVVGFTAMLLIGMLFTR